ncbi:MAG: glycosyltransferase [Clostridia bacterium]|nr:glycosyltransferase [Clostridia bacterium]
MKKVLQVTIGDTFRGTEKIELDWFRIINKEVKFDFLVVDDKVFNLYKDEINKLGGNIYNINVKYTSLKNKIIYFYRLYKFLRNNQYDAIHINSSAFFYSFIVAIISKLKKIPKIIIHSHSLPLINKTKKSIIKLLNPVYRVFFDEYLACSKKAANALFTNNFIKKDGVKILKNGIDIEKFKFNENLRKEYRKKFNISNEIVLGNVGVLENQKNHMYLIDIFYEIQKINTNTILLLIGEGKDKEKIQEKVKKLKIEEKVKFLGFRDDVSNILNCMDIFIFPSLSEELGIAAIEAQTNGLITYCSTKVPEEAKISNNFRFFNLDEKPYEIARKIYNENINIENRYIAFEYTLKCGYDIKDVSYELLKIYLN